jgi:hypothetical protein
MTPMPPGYMLCRPASTGPRCRNCRRWVDHPGQPAGQCARVVNATGQRDRACVHIQISRVEEQK